MKPTDEMVEKAAMALSPWTFRSVEILNAMPAAEQADILRRCQRRQNEQGCETSRKQARVALNAALADVPESASQAPDYCYDLDLWEIMYL